MINYILNGKVVIYHLTVGSIKKILCHSINCIKMSQYLPKLYDPFGEDTNINVDLSNYVTKTDIKNILHVDTLSLH